MKPHPFPLAVNIGTDIVHLPRIARLVSRPNGYLTRFTRRILHDVLGADLTVVEREFTLVGVNPALDDFKDLAAGMHQGRTGVRTHPSKFRFTSRVWIGSLS